MYDSLPLQMVGEGLADLCTLPSGITMTAEESIFNKNNPHGVIPPKEGGNCSPPRFDDLERGDDVEAVNLIDDRQGAALNLDDSARGVSPLHP